MGVVVEAAHKDTWPAKEAVGFEHNTAEEAGPCRETKAFHRCQHIDCLQEKQAQCTNVSQRCEWSPEVEESCAWQYHTRSIHKGVNAQGATKLSLVATTHA